jgi:hypothetical protein
MYLFNKMIYLYIPFPEKKIKKEKNFYNYKYNFFSAITIK